jgi:serine/threonine-protein kinase
VATQGAQGQPSPESLLCREAMVGRVVAHPHLVAILSANVKQLPYYLVMPLLEGASLETAISQHAPLPVPYALWIARQIAEALAALHEAGWMHADVKPANIIVSTEGHATLVDLGFALKLDTEECAAGAALRGTMTYTAPEMISSAVSVNGQCDIYSLGVTLFEMLTGAPPFVASDPGKLALAHMQQAVPSPRRTAPLLSRDVSRLLEAMLAKQPLRRPNADELTRELADLEIATLEERIA